MLTANQIKAYSKLKQRKHREISKKFLIEGEHLIEECIKSSRFHDTIEVILINSGFSNKFLLEKLSAKKIKVEILKENQFNKISETESSQGIIGVVDFSGFQSNELPEGLTIALENISDPGNLGTILRTAWWFGIKHIIIGKNSVDILNAKTLRASQGAIFNINIESEINLYDFLTTAAKKGYDVVLTTLDSGNLISSYRFDNNKNIIIVFGNEANGISTNLKSIPSVKSLKIEGYSDCESLNVAQSVAIFLYHFKSVN